MFTVHSFWSQRAPDHRRRKKRMGAHAQELLRLGIRANTWNIVKLPIHHRQ
jgi:hypothetical protein